MLTFCVLFQKIRLLVRIDDDVATVRAKMQAATGHYEVKV